ncbi:hypothetical protein [Mesorhizobium sp. STM 4661]|uniref:hypothetical protein n=1 Tax=Mesorhizobium sp. STM 4661 TaxID=1297570 RepID=UPI0002BD7C1B|nr:hypothetical protein [Mesorhizobium sp. STM 4661]CCV12895.1 conserved hypothetical protein [Mesorhizobium sp. STM 4661]
MNQHITVPLVFQAPPPEQMAADHLQRRVTQFLVDAFPEDPVVRPKVRVYRFLEEAMELAQAMGVTRWQAFKLLWYVFGRPVGDVKQELGGTVFTLVGVANSLGTNIIREGHASVDEAYGRIDKIRAKSKTKPRAW